MPHYSQRSQERLESCHEDLIVLFEDVIAVTDCSILCGTRTREDQDLAFSEGHSQLKYPNSKHNQSPSSAIDVIPYPVDWDDIYSFFHLAGVVKGIAYSRGIDITWGGDWKSLKDYPHYELRK